MTRALPLLLLLAACDVRPAPARPAEGLDPVRSMIARLQEFDAEQPGHGRFHRIDNALQNRLWDALAALPPGPGVDEVLLEAVDRVWTRYDANYLQGVVFHWPYLDSSRAIALCDRLLEQHPRSPHAEQALWLKAFAQRAPALEPWPDLEMSSGCYGRQVKWKPDLDGARETLARLVADFPGSPRGRAARSLLEGGVFPVPLPKGPREPDPRKP